MDFPVITPAMPNLTITKHDPHARRAEVLK